MIGEEHCKGCFEYNIGNDGYPSWCPVVPSKDDRDCPCGVCLVKMLECEEPCQEWYDYDQFVNGDGPRG